MIKLYFNESNYIKEDIEAVKKYYPNIEDDMFMNLIALDPTYRDGSNSVGKYGKWILNLYNKGNLSNDDMDSITDVLNQFTIYRNRIQNKDLNSYKSLSALEDILATVVDDDSMLTDRQKLRFLKNVKSGKIKTSAADDYDVVLETPKFIVYVPNTHEASMLLGKDTRWCTAYEDPHWYNHYTKDNGKLYIIKDKETGNRWQYSDLTGDFLNEWDSSFMVADLMKQDKKLSKFFEKFLGIDYYRFNGTYIYDGTNPVGYDLKKYVTKIIIDNNVTEIGEDAFNNCKNVKRINIPDNVTKIGKKAFCDCTNLESVIIPNSVTEIGFEAFVDCESLKSINIPDSVTEIEEDAFCRCKSLTSITLSNSITELMRGVFCGCKNLKSITIPNGVTYIGIYAFDGCTNLKSITIPDSVTTIWGCAFRDCTNLKSITIPDGVTEIREGVFSGCENLKSIIIPNSVTKIGHDVFNGCTSLKSVTIPNSVTEIGEDAFWHCENLTVRSNNKYIIDYCKEYNIPVKPLNNNESFNSSIKLHIRES